MHCVIVVITVFIALFPYCIVLLKFIQLFGYPTASV